MEQAERVYQKGVTTMNLVKCFGDIVIMNLPTWIIAAFTGVLAFFTIKYAKVTEKLLKQSEEAAKQSRTAFLINVVDRTIQDITQPLTDGRTSEFAGSFAGKLAIIDRMDEEAAKEILEALNSWCNQASGNIKRKCKKFLDKYKEL